MDGPSWTPNKPKKTVTEIIYVINPKMAHLCFPFELSHFGVCDYHVI